MEELWMLTESPFLRSESATLMPSRVIFVSGLTTIVCVTPWASLIFMLLALASMLLTVPVTVADATGDVPDAAEGVAG